MPLPHQLDGDITHTGPKAGFFDATPVVQPSALTAASAVTLLADRLLAGTPALAIGSTDTQVATGLIYYAIATVLYSKAAARNPYENATRRSFLAHQTLHPSPSIVVAHLPDQAALTRSPTGR